MAEHSRYNVSGAEDAGILKNKLGIKEQKALEDIETILFSDSYKHFFDFSIKKKLKFDLKLIFQIHKYFLGTLYSWAGKIRTVEISKDGILFCSSSQIRNSLRDFEKNLRNNMPSAKDTKRIVSEKLAIIHCEFNAIHPFREGNGRTIRLFLDLLAVNYGFSLIDYAKSSRSDYIRACVSGMSKDYLKMQKIITKGLFK